MFERLSDGFNNALRKLSGKSEISESNVREAMGEVRTALLEADVEYDIVNEFCEQVVQDALGQQVTKSLQPGQEMVGIVHQALINLISQGDEDAGGIMRMSPGPTIIMMCGLQGSGKTTTCGKLAAYLKKRGRSCMVAAADLQRPAAVDQLKTVVEQVEAEMPGGAQVHFYAEPDKVAEYGKAVGVAPKVCENALKAAREKGVDTLILDTAGRLHINDELMTELGAVNRRLTPHQIFLVVDAMTGQDAVNSAKAFNEQLNVDGVILTKFDSDTRGGAALTVRKVTGAPIRFIGVGEKLDALEEFHAERIAGRILGMGDVVSLVEKAQEQVSEEDAERLAKKMEKGELTMEDFLDQLKSLHRMGPMKQLLGMLPGVGSMLKDMQVDEKQLDRVEGIVHGMTPRERRETKVLNPSRRRRVARGSGVELKEVNQLVKQFDMLSRVTKQMSGMNMGSKAKALQEMRSGAAGMPGLEGMPMLGSGKKGTRSGGGGKKRFKKRKR